MRSPIDARRARVLFCKKKPTVGPRSFFQNNLSRSCASKFYQKIFLRISERNEYAIRESSISAIRFGARIRKNSKNLNDAAFIPNR
jgi:hypothetical protein